MNATELKSRAERLASRLTAMGFTKNGEPLVVDQAYELVAAEEGFRNQHVLRTKLTASLAGAETFHPAALVIPRNIDDDEEFAQAVMVQSSLSDSDWALATEAWALIVEVAAKRAGIALALPESEEAAERAWMGVVNKQGWNRESEIQHLEGFIRANGLMVDFAKYAEHAARKENGNVSSFAASAADLVADLDEAQIESSQEMLMRCGFLFEACINSGFEWSYFSQSRVVSNEVEATAQALRYAVLLVGLPDAIYHQTPFDALLVLIESALTGRSVKPSSAPGDDARAQAIAEHVYQEFEFDSDVESADGWEWTSGSNVFMRNVYLSTDGDATNKVRFTVIVTGETGEGYESNSI
jgi:hypothetical protein